jgi:hypothetical protein
MEGYINEQGEFIRGSDTPEKKPIEESRNVRYSVTLEGDVLGLMVPETIVVVAINEDDAKAKASKQSVLGNPSVKKIEKIDFSKNKK